MLTRREPDIYSKCSVESRFMYLDVIDLAPIPGIFHWHFQDKIVKIYVGVNSDGVRSV
jgi:hypothetical protein